MHRTTNRFWTCFESLSADVQKLARKNFSLVQGDPDHPSLHLKKIGKFWSARVGLHHRALAVEDDKDFLWVWIGRHEEYDRLLKTR